MEDEEIRVAETDLLRRFVALAEGLKWWFENKTLVEIIDHGRITLERYYIETGMLRDDYDILVRRAKKLETPYVFKAHEYGNFPRGYAKLVNRNTTAIVVKEGVFDNDNLAQGMFIIIYPFDKVGTDEDFSLLCKAIAKLRADAVNHFIQWQGGYIDGEEYGRHSNLYNMFLCKDRESDSTMVSNLALSNAGGYRDVRPLEDCTCLEEIDLDGIRGFVPRNHTRLRAVLQGNQSLSERIQLADAGKPYTTHTFKPHRLTDGEFLAQLKADIPQSFLKEEVRSGYTVTTRMKRHWALCLDLVSELDRVCHENGIRWFADGGTLLGAVRHQGFVPWDDDIDVMLPRHDYDRLLEHASSFRGKYFLQTFETDCVCKAKARLMNLESSVLLKYEAICHKGHQEKAGCFIDIFPLDNIIDDAQWADLCKRRLPHLRRANYFKSLWERTGEDRYKAEMTRHYSLFDGITKESIALGRTRYGANLGFLQSASFLKREMEDFDEVEYLPFEMISLPCPKGYRRCLDYIYGKDWHVFKKGLACHSVWKYDADTPFTEYYGYYNQLTKIQ